MAMQCDDAEKHRKGLPSIGQKSRALNTEAGTWLERQRWQYAHNHKKEFEDEAIQEKQASRSH